MKRIVAWSAAAVLAPVALAYPVPVRNVRTLVEQSTLVCKVAVISVEEAGPSSRELNGRFVPVNIKVARARVESVIKGDAAGEQIAIEVLAHDVIPFASLEAGEHRLLFLAADTRAGHYVLADPFTAVMNIGAGKTVFRSAEPLKRLEQEIAASLLDSDASVRLDALEQYPNLGFDDSIETVRQAANLADAATQAAALSALIKMGDLSSLRAAAAFVEEGREGALKVAAAIARIRNSAAVSELVEFAASENPMLRANAVRSLRELADGRAVGALVRALEDPQPDVRYDALIGLARTDKSDSAWAPARDFFDGNEAQYVNRWKQWYESTGRRKYRPPQ